jgi:Domain of unknown function (DUF4136)
MIEWRETSIVGHAKQLILRRDVIAVFFLIVCAATPTAAQSVTYDYDRAATFSNYKRYAWTRCTELTEANHERVVQAIDAGLAAKGLGRVDAAASPDVLVAYHANFEIDGSPDWGPLVSGGSAWGVASVQRFLVATLVIDISDARTGATVWHSLFSTDIKSTASPDSRGKTIAKAMEKMLKKYPPKPERPRVDARSTQR